MGDNQGVVIAVGNLKGGTGKSTVAINLGCALAAEGRSVAIVDTDPQGTATVWASRRSLPASVESMPIRNLTEASEWLGGLEAVRARNEVTILDLPAVVSPALGSAFMVAQLVLVPSAPSEVDVAATVRTLRHVRVARRERRRDPPGVLIVPTRVGRNWWGSSDMGSALRRLGEAIGPALHLDKRHGLAFSRWQWIGAYAPGSRAHRDVLALKKAASTVLGLSPARAPRRQSRAASPVNRAREKDEVGAPA